MEPLFRWFEATAIGTVVRESLWLFPVIECVHLLALALLGGVVLAGDLPLLGAKLPRAGRQLEPWLRGALFTIIATGIPMFLSEAIKCYFSPPFFYKMALLLLATIYTFTWRQRVTRAEPGTVRPRIEQLTGAVSLALWFGVGFSGRWIAFY
ncbi:MAG: hypothetical protein K2X03_03175 [Bryobacteraceae bacterium]|nr:hypothetical protein [Bryobacteraceae bacterium]